MGVIWHKVWADLWWNKARSAMVVLSITVGVFAMGGIFGMADLLLSGMDQAHLAVEPSHINVILRGAVDRETVAEIARVPGVLGVDPVNQRPLRFKRPGSDEWEVGAAVMRDDYARQTYDVLELKSGRWPDGGRIGVERLTRDHLGLGVGDEVTLETPGGERRFEIGGVVRHPFVEPPSFGGQAHFFVDAETLAELGVPAGRYGQLLVRIAPYSYERALEVAGLIRARLGELGVDVAVTIFQEPARHWGRRFAEGVTVMMEIISIASLVLSVILVMTVMSAIINQQTAQIGVIKAVGGRQGVIFAVFMANVAAFGLAAFLISVLLGAGFAFVMTRWFLHLFNIDYDTFQISGRAVLLQAIAALLGPALAALPPVLKGTRISVREAISSYGLGSDFGSTWLDRAVERVGARLLSTPYATALGNMFRRKGRLALTLLVLVIGGVLFLSVTSLISSTELTLDNDTARRRYDLRIGFAEMQQEREVLDVVAGVAGVERAEVWYRRNALILEAGERVERASGLTAALVGLPQGTELYRPIVVAGRWLAADDGRAVVMSAEVAERNGLAPGDRIALHVGRETSEGWEIVGTHRTVMGGGFALEPLYAPIGEARAAFGGAGEGSQVVVATSARERPERLAEIERELRARLRARDMDVDLYSSSNVLDERDEAYAQLRTVIVLFLVLALLIAVVGGIGLAGSLGIAVTERTREIGVMRSIGASARQITAIFVMEGLLQGLASWVVAVPVAFVVARPLAILLGQTMLRVDLDYAFDGLAVVFWLGLVIVISLLASIWPATRATRTSVRESLTYQ
jgi:putative ABC transport system permease protein